MLASMSLQALNADLEAKASKLQLAVDAAAEQLQQQEELRRVALEQQVGWASIHYPQMTVHEPSGSPQAQLLSIPYLPFWHG